jgi:DNA-binding transcriptional LysR family regulator
LDISLLEMTSVQQAKALKSGRIDVGFGRLAIQNEGLENIVLADENLVVAMSAHSSLAAERRVSLVRLLDETVILYPAAPRPSFADQIQHQFTIRGFELTRVLETNGLQTAIGLVAAGMGVTIVPESVQRLRRDDVLYRPLSDKGLTSPLIMTIRAGDASARVSEFRKMIVTSMGGAESIATRANPGKL